MANTEPYRKRKFVQTECKGDGFLQILEDRAKKDNLWKNGKPIVSEANRRIVLELQSKIILSPEVEKVFQPLFKHYGINGSNFESQLLAFGKYIVHNNGFDKSETRNNGNNRKKHVRREREFRGYRDGIWYPSNIWQG